MNPAAGVKVRFAAPKVTVPAVGWVTAVMVSGSPLGSVSLPSTATVTGWSAGAPAWSACATGAALATVSVTVVVAVPPWSSART
jgi:hypothetical protein